MEGKNPTVKDPEKYLANRKKTDHWKRKKRKRKNKTEEKITSVSAYFRANIRARAILNCLFIFNA
jgi:hypothetical protein